MHKSFLKLLVLGVIGIGVSIWAILYLYSAAAGADTTVTLAADQLTPDSKVLSRRGKAYFSVRSRGAELAKTKNSGVAGVYEFLNKSIRINDGEQISLDKLPPELEPQKILSDQEDPILSRAGLGKARKHYFFRQKINGLRVFGSQVLVHQENENQVYAMNGAILQDKTLQREHIPEDQARTIAQNATKGRSMPDIVSAEKVAVNPQLAGISEDDKTYPALVVVTNNRVADGLEDTHRTIVSLTDGAVLQTVELADYVLDRRIFDCAQNTSGSCTLKRVEGSVTSGIKDADLMYGFLGDIYAFYSTNMQRDSYDNLGATIKAYVNLPAELNGIKLCPNARWMHAAEGVENQLQVCPDWTTKDVVAHEMTHGVVEYTANLDFLNQSGALNEAIADIFAVGIDDDWTIGEDLPTGVIRNMGNPGSNKTPGPDRMYATNYYCGTGDRGGVHINMTVPAKGFYLMVTGGTFNTCQLTGIGKDKALLVWYQALSKYITSNANFRDAYNAIVQGCTDLYGAASHECTHVKRALQAVEMDQQPLGTQSGPRCNNIAAKTPTCVGAVDPPTATTAPVTNTPVVTITGGSCSAIPGDSNHDGRVTIADYVAWRNAYLAR